MEHEFFALGVFLGFWVGFCIANAWRTRPRQAPDDATPHATEGSIVSPLAPVPNHECRFHPEVR